MADPIEEAIKLLDSTSKAVKAATALKAVTVGVGSRWEEVAKSFEKVGGVFSSMEKNGESLLNFAKDAVAAVEQGAVVSEKYQKISAAAGVAFSSLERTLGELKFMAGLQLAEALTPIVNAINLWVIANQSLISQRLATLLAILPGVVDVAAKAFGFLWWAVGLVIDAVGWLSDVVGPDAVGWLVGLTMVIPAVLTVLSAMAGAFSMLQGTLMVMDRAIMFVARAMMLGWRVAVILANGLAYLWRALQAVYYVGRILIGLFTFSPFTIWIVGIGLLIAALLTVYQNWDAMVDYVKDAWERMKAVFDAQGFFGALWQGVLELSQGYLNLVIGLFKKIPLVGKLIPADFQYDFANANAAAATGKQTAAVSAAGKMAAATSAAKALPAKPAATSPFDEMKLKPGSLTAGKVANTQQQGFYGRLVIEILGGKDKVKVSEMKSNNRNFQVDIMNLGVTGTP